jgi:hypothetical protein
VWIRFKTRLKTVKKFYNFIFLFLLFNSVRAQPLVKQWDFSYGGYDSDFLDQLIATPDGGFAACGISLSNISYEKSTDNWAPGTYTYDWWIIKCDATGIKQWDINLGGTDQDFFYNATATSDGGLIAVGSVNSLVNGNITLPSLGGPDMWVVKLSSTGSIQWQKRYGNNQVDVGSSIMEVPGGGYAIGGHTNSGQGQDVSQASYGGFDFWMLRLDANGNKLWDKRFGGSGDESVSKIMTAANNGFMLVGSSSSPVSGVKTQPNYVAGKSDMWWILTDVNGNKVWDKVRGSLEDDIAIKAMYTSDGNYLASAMTYANAGADKTENSYNVDDIWVIKFDPSLNTIWDHSVGGNSEDGDGGNLSQMQDGSYLISGTSYSDPGFWKTETNIGPENTWVVKIDPLGNKVWDKTILTGYAHDEVGFAIQLADGCIIIANEGDALIGGDKTDDSYNFDYWCIKFCDMSVPLPVELLSFEGTNSGNKNNLKWMTASETNNNHFELERRSGIEEFKTIASIKGHGTTTSTGKYNFEDMNIFPGEIYYYRLRQVDNNGFSSYSKIIKIKASDEIVSVIVSPNPFIENTNISYFLKKNSNVALEIFTLTGNKIAVLQNGFQQAGNYSYRFNAQTFGYSPQVYHVRLTSDEKIYNIKLVGK